MFALGGVCTEVEGLDRPLSRIVRCVACALALLFLLHVRSLVLVARCRTIVAQAAVLDSSGHLVSLGNAVCVCVCVCVYFARAYSGVPAGAPRDVGGALPVRL